MDNGDYPPAQNAPMNGGVSSEAKRCAWCGALNPPDAVRCGTCDAAFPTLAGEIALQQAAAIRRRELESRIAEDERRSRRRRFLLG